MSHEKLESPGGAGQADLGITGSYLHARFSGHPTGSISTCSALGVQSKRESKKTHGSPLSSQLHPQRTHPSPSLARRTCEALRSSGALVRGETGTVNGHRGGTLG